MILNIVIDRIILVMCAIYLLLSMLNGYLLHNKIHLFLSIAQLFSLLILSFILLSLFLKKKYTFLIGFIGLFLILYVPSIVQFFSTDELKTFIFDDFIKLLKYASTFIYIYYFSVLLKKNQNLFAKYFFNIVKISFLILVGNIMLKYIGMGYPMYKHGNIGSTGFFYAGNSVSLLLMVLSAILAIFYWQQSKYFKYIVLFAIALFTGFTISSKTGILGIILVFLLIPIKRPRLSLIQHRGVLNLIPIIVIFPILIFQAWRFVKKSEIFARLEYFWQKLDFVTFILSNRNTFFNRAIENYKENYNALEKIIGIGHYHFEKMNEGKIIEIDFLDIFFGYGFVGVFVFIAIIWYLLVKSFKNSLYKDFIYSNFVFFMVVVLFIISSMAGHVFSSGFSSIYIGLLFSLFHFKKSLVAVG